MSAPELIWIEGDADETKEGYGSWDCRNVYDYNVKYIRADTHAAKACPCFNVPAWLTRKPKPQPEIVDATNTARLRWRLAEIRDIADTALKEK